MLFYIINYYLSSIFTTADILNDKVLSFFESHMIPILRILTDRGTEYTGAPEKHLFELYLEVNDIEHTATKAKSPQTNGICERFHQTILNEFYKLAFRKNIYKSVEQLQLYSCQYRLINIMGDDVGRYPGFLFPIS